MTNSIQQFAEVPTPILIHLLQSMFQGAEASPAYNGAAFIIIGILLERQKNGDPDANEYSGFIANMPMPESPALENLAQT